MSTKLEDLSPEHQAQARAQMGATPKNPHKYHAQPSILAGRRFDSKLERDRAGELELLQQAGAISNLEFQVTFRLSEASVTYRADFVYTEDGRPVVEDVKGMATPRFRMIKKLWRAYGPAVLRITKRNKYGRIVTAQEITPKQGTLP